MRKVLTFIISALACSSVTAYDLSVIMEVEETHERLEGMSVQATYPDGKFITGATYNAADTTYLLKGLPNEALHVRYVLGGNQYAEEVNTPVDTLVAPVPAALLARSLKEVEVAADSQFLTPDRLVVTPSKRDIKISIDANALLRNMSIANVIVSADGNITTASGSNYSIFIDYLPASDSDMTNMLTKNVQRVEVYENPADPRFNGARNVINFIMVKYEYGGYTRVKGEQRFMYDLGKYSAFSRFVYRKMTYDVNVNAYYNRSRHFRNESEMHYKLPSGVVTRTSDIIESLNKSHGSSACVKALYQDQSKAIQNIVIMSSSKAPGNYSMLDERFNAPGYISSINSTESNSDDLSFNWNGNYYITLPNQMSLNIYPSASYGEFKNRYTYNAGANSINNDACDKAWISSVKASLSKYLHGHQFSISLFGKATGNKINYLGTSPSNVNINSYDVSVNAFANLRFGRLTLMPSFTFYYYNQHHNNLSSTEWKPKYYLSASYYINRHNNISFGSSMSYWTNSMQQRSPIFQITDQVTGSQGNPDLKPMLYNEAVLSYTYLPLQNLFLNAYIRYTRFSNQIVYLYDTFEFGGRDYLMSTPYNIGFLNKLGYGLSASTSLFNNNLSMTAYVGFNSYGQHGPYYFNGTRVNYGANATYSFGSFYVSAAYTSEQFSLSTSSNSKNPHSYYIHAGWTKGDLHLAATVYNPFTTSYKGDFTEYMLPELNGWRQSYSPFNRCAVEIGVVYTVSYGKKVSRDSEVDNAGSGSVSSGIIK